MFRYHPVRHLLLICLTLLTSCAAPHRLVAQTSLSYNLNSDNGLPSDKIYAITIDRHGYLWICTDHGLVKYNGYTCKLFSVAEGLANEDVWGLTEDRKGRMWIQTISNEIGYIADDKYHKAHLKNMDGLVYPRNMKRYDSGILFYCSINLEPEGQIICYEQNDTIFQFKVKGDYFTNSGKEKQFATYISGNEKVIFYKNGRNYSFGNLRDVFNKGAQPIMQELAPIINNNLDKYFGKRQTFTIGDYLLSQQTNTASTIVYTLNTSTGVWDSIDVAQYGVHEAVDHVIFDATSANDNKFFIATNNNVLTFACRENIRHLSTHNVKQLIENTDGKKRIMAYTNGTLWDTCIATVENGLYCAMGNKKYQLLPELSLKGYTHIGTVNDCVSYWWNTDEKKIIAINDKHIAKEYQMKHTHEIFKAISLGQDSVLLLGTFNYYLNTRNDKIHEIGVEKYGRQTRQVIITSPTHYFSILKGGIEETSLKPGNSSADRKDIDIDRYDDAAYDSVGNVLWAYHSTKILMRDSSQQHIIKNTDISNAPTDKIEKICIDAKFGNVFIKSTGSVNIYKTEKNNCSEILKNINLKNATIEVSKDMLIVIGDFGVLFAKIKGKGILSTPIIYYNSKKLYFKKRYGYAITQGSLLLSTEKGTYEIAVPTDSEFNDTSPQNNLLSHKVVTNYNGALTVMLPGDTIVVDQNNRTIFLDVINPRGNGAISYRYKAGKTNNWETSNSSEIILPDSFTPGNYYPAYVQWADDAYRSDVIKILVYVKPNWWQTKFAKRIIWTGGSLFGILTVVISILVTRRMVLKASEKKHLQMELELKSIYAQINPHFIFNSLTSALLLISKNRMDEAYTHVSRFSKLLRNYLKSSRNKYISLADEIENLKNYIELQQTRFKDRFTCDITVDPDLDSDQINIPALLIQPFVENAINHGILHSHVRGKINLDFKSIKKGKSIQCIISDNGIGREKSRALKNSEENAVPSYGNLLIKDLVDVFNRYEKMNIQITYEDKAEPEMGTSVIITISNIQI